MSTKKIAKKEQLDEISPAQKAKLEKLKEIGQKMKDVNNIFVTGQKMKDDVLIAGARAKLAQLAKIKHDLEQQPVDEDKSVGDAGTWTVVFSSAKTPYSWTKFYATDENDARQRIKEIFKRHGFTDAVVKSISKDTAVEEAKVDKVVAKRLADRKAEAKQFNKLIKKYPDMKGTYQGIAKLKGIQLEDIGDIKVTPVAGPGATAGEEQVDEVFADQGAGSGATGVDNNNEVIHRVAVTMTDPNDPLVSKRKEGIGKVIRVKGDRKTAEARARSHYKKQGYKIIDSWYIGEVEGDELNEGHAGERGPEEAGAADAYYGRKRSPNKSVAGQKIPVTDPEEVAAYNRGYDENDEKKDFSEPKYRGPRTAKGVDEDLNEVKSGPIKNHPWVGKQVKTPTGGGIVTAVVREPTFSQMVPWKTIVRVKFADGSVDEFRKEHVRTIKTAEQVTEDNEGVDTIEMDVALFIRCLEWAKESAPDDVALHKFTENVLAKNGVLTMDDYESLVPKGMPVEEAKIKIKEDASAGATGSVSVATVVSGTPGIIKRTGTTKKKGRYGNSVSSKTFSAVSKGIYESIESEVSHKRAQVELVKNAWMQVMPNSSVYIRDIMGTTFFNFLLSKDKTEVANGILENDPLSYSAKIDDHAFKEINGSLFVKPTEPHMAFGREKFRLKTIKNPTSEQLVKRFTDIRNFIMSNADKLKDLKFNIKEK